MNENGFEQFRQAVGSVAGVPADVPYMADVSEAWNVVVHVPYATEAEATAARDSPNLANFGALDQALYQSGLDWQTAYLSSNSVEPELVCVHTGQSDAQPEVG